MLEYFCYRYVSYLDDKPFTKSLILVFKDVGISKELSNLLKKPVTDYIKDMNGDYELFDFKHVNSIKENNKSNEILWIEIKTSLHILEEFELVARQFKAKYGRKFLEFYEKEKNEFKELNLLKF